MVEESRRKMSSKKLSRRMPARSAGTTARKLEAEPMAEECTIDDFVKVDLSRPPSKRRTSRKRTSCRT